MINTAEFRDLIRDVAREEIGDKTRYKIGEIASVGNKVRIKFSGEQDPSLKEYSYLKSYFPVIGDRVWLARDKGTYVVLGKINRDISEPFYIGEDLQVGGDVYIKGALAGHIIESGSNTNGHYVKFSDGTQICSFYGSRSLSIPNAYGSLYQNSFTCTYPAPFINKPSVSIGQIQWETGASWGMVSATNTGTVAFRVIDVMKRSTASMDISYIAIGRWK